MPNNSLANQKVNSKHSISAFDFFRSSSTATLGRILGRVTTYIAQIILARILAPDGFGLFAIGWTILRLFSIGGHLGLDFGVINFGSQFWNKDQSRLRSVIVFSLSGALVSGFLFGLLIYSSAPWLAIQIFKKPELILILKGFAFTFPFATSLRVLAATSSISGKMLCGGIAEDITQPILQVILFLIFYQTNMGGINAALLSTALSYAIAVFLGILCVARLVPNVIKLGPIVFKDLVPLYHYSLPTILAVTLGAFNLWGDRLIVGYFETNKETGIYQSISLISMITVVILSGIKAAMAPTISHLFHSGENQKLKSLAKKTTKWSLYLSIPILLTIAIIPGEIISLTFGPEYLSGKTPLLWLTLGQLFYVTLGVADQFFLMTGRQKDWLLISLIVFILTVTLDYILIPRIGLTGAAFVSCATTFLIGIIAFFWIKKVLHFWLIDIRHLKPLFAAILSGFVTYSLIRQWNLLPIYRFIVTIGLSSSLFTLILLLIGVEEDINIFKQVFNKSENS